MARALTDFLSAATGNQRNQGRHDSTSEFALGPQANFKETALIWESMFLSQLYP